MNKYELLLIFSHTLAEKDFHAEVSEFRDFLKKNAKGVFFEDVWGMKSLAYRIKKFDQGYYAILYFEAEPEQIQELSAAIRLNTHIIRHLLILLPEGFEAKKHEETGMEEIFGASEERPTKHGRKFEKKTVVKPLRGEKAEMAVVEGPAVTADTLLKGKTEEEKLKQVEKTLESILENPDIQLK